MCRIVILNVSGRPQAKGRPKFHQKPTRRGRYGYTPEHTRDAEAALQAEMRAVCSVPLEGPLELCLFFCFKRPASWPAARRHKVDMGYESYYTGKPDLDNLVKLVKDAGNGILWRDDAQVVKLEAHKMYSSESETGIQVMELKEE